MAKLKYISYEGLNGDINFVIFPIIQQHDAIARTMELLKKDIKSAGFVNFTGDEAQCWGDSTSLNVKTGKDDTKILSILYRL